MPSPKLLLFGPLSSSLSPSTLENLRTTIISTSTHAWVEDAFISLLVEYTALCREFPELYDADVKSSIAKLPAWLRTGDVTPNTEQISNTLLAPLVVVAQLVQYRTFFEKQGLDYKQSKVEETSGFCIGLLSALVVSLSHDSAPTQFGQYASTAVRLAMLDGAIVDGQDAKDTSGPSRTLSVAWKRGDTGDRTKDLESLLKKYPDVYISVTYDVTRVSLTAPLSILQELQRDLQDSGYTVAELGLAGRFHSQAHHGHVFQSIVDFCDRSPSFAFPTAKSLTIATQTNNGSSLFDREKSLHSTVLQSILIQKCEWYACVSKLSATCLETPSSSIVLFGETCIPSSLRGALSGRIVNQDDLFTAAASTVRENPNDIAIIGMSLNVAGAPSVSEFWNLLASGKSQHKLVPEERFNFNTAYRDNDGSRKWYGNFIDGLEDFDHKFFKKTPRESVGMDPQQRQLLQCAYQAVEMSGYFNVENHSEDAKNIGCYIGMCGNDYSSNSGHHAPTAFTSTGTLRSFVAGKVSHYFGWLGPSLTLDTACSASAVAIHSACRAIISGECTAALAGGTNAITEPLVYQNLAGASFLSPTGSCKPFDAKADGYCRGEAVSAVLLKSLAQARKDGDVIFGVIAGTAVAQNSNDTPIVVPNSPSLSTLFRSVLKTAKLSAQEVSVVEAHGTGTQVGDPAEYGAIRSVFGQEKDNGVKRTVPLQLGSVKGLVGHTEGSSGVVSLIKVLCMMNEGAIPPQASHSVINPAIGAKESDGIQISLQQKVWDAKFKAAMINNYGASGSNATMVVTQAPTPRSRTTSAGKDVTEKLDIKYPLWISGLDDKSIRTYTTKLHALLKQKPNIAMADLAFNIFRQSNRTLSRALLLSARSVSELTEKLSKLDADAGASIDIPSPRPVVLCFGGQISTTIALDRAVYDNTTLLRHHMDRCNALAISLGAGSIYPAVFQPTPIADIVLLQAALFAVQYSTAQCWLESGLHPVSVVGHSFGELTAMCVSGALGVEDAMKLIIGRATLIRDSWGPEKGTMVAVEGTEEEVLNALGEIGPDSTASIACFNAPRSHTVAGSNKDIDSFAEALSSNHPELRFKKLAVSNAYHSSLVAPLRSELQKIGKGLTFGTPTIPVERAIRDDTTGAAYDADFVANHLQNPVCFSHAVARLAKKYPSAIWLEAGSNATITSMASKALNAPPAHHFQAINLSTAQGGLQRLLDSTAQLWKAGLRVAYWGHSKAQTAEYNPILLPPYQFEKKKHWLEHKEPPKTVASVCDHAVVETGEKELPTKLYTFTGYQDSKQRLARFRVNTMIPRYEQIVAGHTIAGAASICPATVQIDVTIEAIRSLEKELAENNVQPQINNVLNRVPVCVDPSRSVWLDLEALNANRTVWSWKWTSTGISGAAPTTHVTGELHFRSSNDLQYQSEFSRYERLVSHSRCVQALYSKDADEVLQGQRSIYRIFAPIVDYSPMYFGVRRVVGQDSVSAGLVVKQHGGDCWLDAFYADALCQVAGIWVNCMMDGDEKDMWIANGVEHWLRAPAANIQSSSSTKWHVFCQHSRSADGNSVLSDIFIFDASSGALTEVIMGVKYAKVARVSMGKLLSRLTGQTGTVKAAVSQSVTSVLKAPAETPVSSQPTPQAVATPKAQKAQPAPETPSINITEKLKAVLADISGLEPEEIKDDVELGDIGIDSLMGMEMAREIEKEFKCTLPQDELMHVTNFPSLLRCVQGALGAPTDSAVPSSSASSNGTEDETPGASTPATSVDLDFSETLPKGLQLPQSTILKAFGETKLTTDRMMEEYGNRGYLSTIAPLQDQLCVALIIEGFKELGCDLAAAKSGENLPTIPHANDQKRFAKYLYTVLQTARIVDIKNGSITRTHIAGPLKILEMGAGTGATTKMILPLLAELEIEVEFTFTDLAASFVAAARKKFKHLSFMKFRTHDIEKAPADDLLHSQHIVLASNAVHATHSLPIAATNIRKMLRPDGVLLMLEMTEPMYWCDIIFGVFEGWWMFEDDRQHALSSTEDWEKVLHGAGYGHVDWSGGHIAETKCQRLIMATSGGEQLPRLPIGPKQQEDFRHEEREAATSKLIEKTASDFAIPSIEESDAIKPPSAGHCVLITGATGSLGSHMTAHYANLPTVASVVCLNRRSYNSDCEPLERQLKSFSSKDISLTSSALSKISAYETDTSKPFLGLSESTYYSLINTVTHIVHNAWPMNGKLPLQAFTPQFRVFRRLLDFAALVSARRQPGFKFTFQFISSIATVGHYPYHTGSSHIPEEQMTIESVLTNGYGDAKFVCERILDETLHKHPSRFNAMVVRLGQVAGSSTSGYWNENEHLAFLIKSSQTLNALPKLDGLVSWTPVDAVAGASADLLLDEHPEGIYHIDNPIRQSWATMLPLLAAELDIAEQNIVPFDEWIRRVRMFPSTGAAGKFDENPAQRLVDFFADDFRRMSCGGILMGTEKSRAHSQRMRDVGPVDKETVHGFVNSWRARGFLL
ncbi:polyketide synthase [Pyrenophora seminiperda CCB06]|uniref:Polyketide synthase n=1 Tax=Pyrenophora seminiperda CCB06 TaxID=1302712 RepID=A0A3M7LVW3_9PLEO|nr:polyketide synthase [Pyrenophora seminiperda CCB06]